MSIPAARCARSRCPRPAVEIVDGPRDLCLRHAAKRPEGRARFAPKRVLGDGRSFQSRAERDVYGELQLLIAAKEMRDLECQVPFELRSSKGRLLERYILDFKVYDRGQRRWRFIDAKAGRYTTEFRRKQKWMLDEYGIDVETWDVKKPRARAR